MAVTFPEQAGSKLSLEEYLVFVATRSEKERWQLIDGEVMCMPRPTLVHQRIASNLMHVLNAHFRQYAPEFCAYFRVGLMVPAAELFRPEADVAVLDAMAGYESYANKFYLVAEILSDSNTDKDIAVKRQRYLQHPDNLYFVLIEQKRVHVEVMARADGWEPHVLDVLDADLELPAWSFQVRVGDLYRGTPLATIV